MTYVIEHAVSLVHDGVPMYYTGKKGDMWSPSKQRAQQFKSKIEAERAGRTLFQPIPVRIAERELGT